MKNIFIVNPYAGKKDSLNLVPFIEDYFKKNKRDDFEIIVTKKKGHATEIAKNYKGDYTIYGVGGDGTIFEILNGLQDGCKMAIIPNGTGNDYFKMLEVPEMDMKDLLVKTIEGRETIVDYGLCNKTRYLNSSNMGLDADINELANDIGKNSPIPKALVYIVAALKSIGNPKSLKFTVKVDDNEPFEKEGYMCGCMTGKYYGGGFQPTPMASIQDGKLDFFFIKVFDKAKMIPLIIKYLQGTHTNEPEAMFFKCEKVVLDSVEEVLYGCDGEVSRSKHIEYEIVKNGLTLRVPKESKLK